MPPRHQIWPPSAPSLRFHVAFTAHALKAGRSPHCLCRLFRPRARQPQPAHCQRERRPFRSTPPPSLIRCAYSRSMSLPILLFWERGESCGFFPSLACHSGRHYYSCAALTITSISGARGTGYSLAAAIDLGTPCGLWQLALAAARPRREGWRWRRQLGFGCAPELPIRERHGAGLPLWTL